MTLSECLEKTVALLKKAEITFAVGGGLAASLYRYEPRLTGDVDVVIATGGHDVSVAKKMLQSLGFEPKLIRKADFDGGPLFAIKKKNTPVVMVGGRENKNLMGVGVDFLLPVLPWVTDALARGQENQVDFGFGLIPVLTVEDVLLTKLYALQSAHNRPKDLDDIQSIMQAAPELDEWYIRIQIEKLGICLTKPKRLLLPEKVVSFF